MDNIPGKNLMEYFDKMSVNIALKDKTKKRASSIENISSDNFRNNFFDIDEATKSKYEFLMKKKEFRNLFWNYTYIREEEKQQVIQNYYFDNPKKIFSHPDSSTRTVPEA